jgi:hypothetical protein
MKESNAVFRYDTSGTWLKGNTHIHSTASDGGKTFAQLAAMYAREGYAFLFRTDHSVASDVETDSAVYPLTWLDGIELNGNDERGAAYHITVLGKVTGFVRGMPLPDALAVASTPGTIIILAHPYWMGNTLDDALCKPFHGVEVYNHVCRWINGRGDSGVYWAAMLDRNPNTLSFACDDTHLVPRHPGWNGGWIVVNVPDAGRESIMSGIRAGNYYSSQGPDFRSLRLEGGSRIVAETSPVVMARLVGPAHRGEPQGGFDGAPMTKCAFDMPPDWAYAFLEIEDAAGRRAWTNTLFAPRS